MGNDRAWLIATRVCVAMLAALLVLLVVTGVLLTFHYRPELEFANVQSLDTPRHLSALRSAHRVGATLFLAAIVAYAVAGIGLVIARHRRALVALPAIAIGLGAVASFSGYLLPWDQLSLTAVTVGSNMQGYTPILRGTNVRYVLVRNHEIATATFSRWYWLHAVVVPLALVAVVVAAVVLSRRRSEPGVN